MLGKELWNLFSRFAFVFAKFDTREVIPTLAGTDFKSSAIGTCHDVQCRIHIRGRARGTVVV
jgi:hypothetical protein